MLSAINIRLATPADAGGCLGIYTPIVASTATSFEVDIPTEAAFAERLRVIGERFPWLVAEADGALAGYAYAGPHRDRVAYQWCTEVSAYVAPRRQRSGVGRALYHCLFAALRHQGFCNAYAGITLPNEASVAFHEAAGFTPIGCYPRIGYKLGLWHDVAWWGLRLQEPPEPPRPPVPLAQCRDEVAAVIAAAASGI